MNFNWNVTHRGHEFLSFGRWHVLLLWLKDSRKRKWIVKIDLLTSKDRGTHELSWGHLPKQVFWCLLRSSCCRRYFHQLHEKSNPAFWLRCGAVLPSSTLWMKKKKWMGMSMGNNLMVGKSSSFGISCIMLPKMAQDRILSSREERSLTIVDSLSFDRTRRGMWSINVD